jgi:hypothetical protein
MWLELCLWPQPGQKLGGGAGAGPAASAGGDAFAVAAAEAPAPGSALPPRASAGSAALVRALPPALARPGVAGIADPGQPSDAAAAVTVAAPAVGAGAKCGSGWGSSSASPRVSPVGGGGRVRAAFSAPPMS